MNIPVSEEVLYLYNERDRAAEALRKLDSLLEAEKNKALSIAIRGAEEKGFTVGTRVSIPGNHHRLLL